MKNVRMTATYEGQTIMAKSVRQICQKMVNAGLFPTDPEGVEVTNFDTGAYISRVRYDEREDVWMKVGKVSAVRVASKTPAKRVTVPAQTVTVTAPEQVIDGVTVPAKEYTVRLPSYTYVDTSSVVTTMEKELRVSWIKVPQSEGMRDTNAPTIAESRQLGVAPKRVRRGVN